MSGATIDFDEIRRLSVGGYISIQAHPTADLHIYNYTPKAQCEHFWTPETRACRGLIADGNDRIVARPFEKFFNIEEHSHLPDEPFKVFEKMDGSLGIVYWVGGEPCVATRGSFVSCQAIAATRMLREQYDPSQLNPDWTYLVEIIYPDNRIVVDYSGEKSLTLLACIHTASGEEMIGIPDVGLPKVRQYDGLDIAAIRSVNDENREGFVIRFDGGLRVKVKTEWYKRLHKLLAGASEHRIWRHMRDGTLDEAASGAPGELVEWILEIESQLNDRFEDVKQTCLCDFHQCPAGDRKAKAAFFMACQYPHILFQMLDGKDYSKAIFDIIEPKGQSGKFDFAMARAKAGARIALATRAQ